MILDTHPVAVYTEGGIIGASGILEPLESWDLGILEPWNLGIMGSWNPWDLGVLEPWNFGILEP